MSVEVINGAVLLPGAPDWNAGLELTLRWRTEIARALSGAEDRAGLRELPIATLRWRAAAAGVAESALLTAQIQQALKFGSVAAPCHSRASLCVAADEGTLTLAPSGWPWAPGDWVWVAGNARAVAGVAGNVLTLASALDAPPVGGTPVYPLLFGKLETEPAQQRAPDAFSVRCCLRVDAFRLGLADATRVYRGLSAAPDLFAAAWAQGVRRRFDDGRLEFTILLEGGAELAAAELFVGGVGGRRDAFWLPSPESAMVIEDGSETQLVIAAQGFADEFAAAGAPIDLWFEHATLAPMAARVTSVGSGTTPDTEVVTLDQALPVALSGDWDAFRLRLVRLETDDLREVTQANDVTALRLAAIELPAGAGPGWQPTYLYRFQATLNPTLTWRATNHATPVTYDGETYPPAAIAHRQPTPETWRLTGLPTGFPADDVIRVTVRRADTGAVLFTGKVGPTTGAETTLLPPADLGARSLPIFRIGASCNHRLFGAGCGLEADAWKVDGALVALSGASVTLAVDPGKADNWFAGGRLMAGLERRTVLASAGVALLLNEPLSAAQLGDAVRVYAGCTRFASECQAKFDNLPRFGGYPFLAERQPTGLLPSFAGWQRLPAAEIAAPANWTDGYRTDLLRAVCRGPVDAVTHLWINGTQVWSGAIARGVEQSVDLTVPGRGTVTLFWGKADQTSPPALAALGHPAYAEQCYLWMPGFLVGPDPSKSPRIEVAVKRYPIVPWLGPSAVNEDANPAAVLAELLMDATFGAGLDGALFDQSQWAATAARLATEDAVCSPVIDRDTKLGAFIDTLCDYLDARLRWTPEGKLQLQLRREPPADLSAVPTLTDNDLLEAPQLAPAANALAAYNRTVVTCVERDRGWTADAGQWQNDGAFDVAGEERLQTLTRPWITRRAVARTLARQVGKAPAPLAGLLRVRSSSAAVLEPGDWVRLSSAQLLQCTARRALSAAAVELTVMGGRAVENPLERFDPGDAICHDPARPTA